MPDPEKHLNRQAIHTIGIYLSISLVAVVVGRQEAIVWKLTRQAEAHDRRLLDVQHGYGGLDDLQGRVTLTQLEQLRLQRKLDKIQKPAGAK